MDWNNINRDRDTSGLGPIEYDQSKVPALIRNHADNVRTKTYGQEVREAQARNAEYAGLIASEADSKATSADLLSKDTQNRFKDQIEGTTNSDEIIDARRPYGLKAFTTLNDRLDAQTKFVNYDMFTEDGLTDGEIIKAAHVYANEHNLPVINPSGEYWLGETVDIPIQTNVDWGSTILHFDQGKSTNRHNFMVIPSKDPVTITDVDKVALLNELKEGRTKSSELAKYNNYLIRIEDTNTVKAIRYLNGVRHTDWKLQDVFYVGQGGVISPKVNYDFEDYTRLTAYWAEENYLTVKGGTFLLENAVFDNTTPEYLSIGFDITRSRVRFREQFIGFVDKDQIYEFNKATNGFYQYHDLYDIEFSDIKNVPRVKNGANLGTYGFYGTRAVKVGYYKVDSDADDATHWGVTSHNIVRDLNFDRVKLSRVDVHYDVTNVSIDNSEIRLILLTGQGKLAIRKSKIINNYIVNFRNDYGGTWDGDIVIDDIELVPTEEDSVNLIEFNNAGYDHGRTIYNGDNVFIDKVVVDFVNVPNLESINSIVAFRGTGYINVQTEIVMFSYLHAKNVKVKNLNNKGGFGLIKFLRPQLLKGRKAGGYRRLPNKELRMTDNVKLVFEDIDVEGRYSNDFAESYTSVASSVTINSQVGAYTSTSLYPRIYISRCNNLNLYPRGAIMHIIVRDSVLKYMNAIQDNYDPTSNCRIDLYDTTVAPDVTFNTSVNVNTTYVFKTPYELNMDGCLIDVSRVNGVASKGKTKDANGMYVFNPTLNRFQKLTNKYDNNVFTQDAYDLLVEDFTNANVFADLLHQSYSLSPRRDTAAVSYGFTNSRPVLSAADYNVGHQFYDRSLKKLLVWTGTAWKEV